MNAKEARVVYTVYMVAFAIILTPTEVQAQRGPVDFYDCSGKPDGNYVHPTDCSKFIACVAGIYAYEMDCVEGLHYDPVRNQCDYPNVVGCVIDPPSTTPGTTVSTTTESTTTQRSTATSTQATVSTSSSSSSTSSGTTAPSVGTSQSPIFDCSGLEDGNYPHPTNCSQFISCVAGEYAYEMDCPAGLHYDPTTDQCDYPEVAGCDPRYTSPVSTSTDTVSSSTPSTQTTSSNPGTTSNPTTSPPVSSTSGTPAPYNCSGLSDGNYRHPTDCSKYIACVAGQYAYEMNCPEGLHYDPTRDICDYPENVDCESSSTPTSPPEETSTTRGTTTGQTETTISSSTPEGTTPSDNSTTTVDPDACDHDCQYVGIDCHNYYSCINFTRKEYHECPYELGLAFNPELLVCDRIENVRGCGAETTTELPTTPEDECGCEYKPHETDCSRYYFCPNSCRQSTCRVLTCPGDLLWSVDFYGDGTSHQQCTLSELATCASKDAGTAHLEFSCYKKHDGLYRNENDCHAYWKCKGGVALLYACPQGFIYNPEIKVCDFPGKSLRFCKTE